MTKALTHPDKVLWPQRGLTKADLASYYEAVADRLLWHLKERPVTLKRFNDGVDGEGFFQKNLPKSAPPAVQRFETWSETSGRTVAYAVINDAEGLRWCAQSNALELHPWFSRVDEPEHPDICAFDLDPWSSEQDVSRAARDVRDSLRDLGLDALVKTSGKRGLHVYVPIERRYGIDDLRAFTLGVARMVAARRPDVYTVEMRKADRGGRLLIDWSRAGGAQTLVAAWSPRATLQATVSTPLSWDEVESGFDPTALTVPGVLERSDPWSDEAVKPQRLEGPAAALRQAGIDLEVISPRARTTAPRTRRSVDLGDS
ncbi:MAG: bifunctional non-ous end joining protein LigD [Acidimicrobiaceae bacterium]|jgi:bifunctional non-homologous end joining protein LigD|nr:bifunctional non-ous end joining protein LigD [Acidimicrobiaceae bacterium]